MISIVVHLMSHKDKHESVWEPLDTVLHMFCRTAIIVSQAHPELLVLACVNRECNEIALSAYQLVHLVLEFICIYDHSCS